MTFLKNIISSYIKYHARTYAYVHVCLTLSLTHTLSLTLSLLLSLPRSLSLSLSLARARALSHQANSRRRQEALSANRALLAPTLQPPPWPAQRVLHKLTTSFWVPRGGRGYTYV
jgi:hypothetical protein